MIANIYAEESPASRMLDMIARCAPKLMRAGGGALTRDYPERCKDGGDTRWDNRAKWVRTTPDQRAHVLALARAGHMSEIEICRETGVKQSAVNKLLARECIKVPSGRRAWNKGRSAK